MKLVSLSLDQGGKPPHVQARNSFLCRFMCHPARPQFIHQADIAQVACRLTARSPDQARWSSGLLSTPRLWSSERSNVGGLGREAASSRPGCRVSQCCRQTCRVAFVRFGLLASRCRAEWFFLGRGICERRTRPNPHVGTTCIPQYGSPKLLFRPAEALRDEADIDKCCRFCQA